MHGTMVDNSSSLSLALGARITVKALYEVQKGREANKKLRKAMDDVSSSLRAYTTPGARLFAHLSPSSSFETFDQIQTLKEVEEEFPGQNVEEMFANVFAATDPERQRQGIAFAIDFFSELERRARQKFNQSDGGEI